MNFLLTVGVDKQPVTAMQPPVTVLTIVFIVYRKRAQRRAESFTTSLVTFYRIQSNLPGRKQIQKPFIPSAFYSPSKKSLTIGIRTMSFYKKRGEKIIQKANCLFAWALLQKAYWYYGCRTWIGIPQALRWK